MVVRARVVPALGADEGQVLDARDVRGTASGAGVQPGKDSAFSFMQVAGREHLALQFAVFGVGAVAPVHALGVRVRRDLLDPAAELIHPSQIEACNAAFSPDADEVEQARKMIAAFDQPENKGKGVVQIDGRMVERMHAEMARRTVAIADAIAARVELPS